MSICPKFLPVSVANSYTKVLRPARPKNSAAEKKISILSWNLALLFTIFCVKIVIKLKPKRRERENVKSTLNVQTISAVEVLKNFYFHFWGLRPNFQHLNNPALCWRAFFKSQKCGARQSCACAQLGRPDVWGMKENYWFGISVFARRRLFRPAGGEGGWQAIFLRER